MLPRERVLKTLHHEKPALIPFEFTLCDHLREQAKKRIHTSDIASYFDFPMKAVRIQSTRRNLHAELHTFVDLDELGLIVHGEWGLLRRPGTYYHFTEPYFPLRGASLETIAAYPVPDYDQNYRWAGVAEQVRGIKASGYFTTAMVGHTFETAWQWCGLDDFLVEMLSESETAHLVLDKITRVQIVHAERWAATGVDMIRLGDDVGSQKGMMMAPALWRRLLKPRLAKVIAAAKSVRPDVFIWYHSDGAIQPIISDLIEIGVDALNPVQPECLDPLWVKQHYGDRLTLWGTIGTQTTMPFATAAEVKQCVVARIAELGQDGGLVLAPTHVLEPDVPWENVMAFAEACQDMFPGRS